MKVKKILVMLVALFGFSLLLGACGNEASNSTNNEGQELQKEDDTNKLDDYPKRAINVIVPWGSGGGTDVTARSFLKVSEENYLSQSFRVNNITGAAGAVGWGEVSASKPDGYTLTVLTVDLLVHSAQGGPVNYNDYIPLALMSQYSEVIAVPNESEFKDLNDLLEFARENPEQIKIANSGIDTYNYFTTLQLENEADVKFNHVPFEGGAEQIAAALGGNVDAVITDVPEISQRPDMRVLAIFSTEKNELLPDAPLVGEYDLNVEAGSFRMLAAPIGTPDEIVQYLEDVFAKTYNDPEFQEFAETQNISPRYMDSDESKKLLDQMFEPLEEVVN